MGICLGIYRGFIMAIPRPGKRLHSELENQYVSSVNQRTKLAIFNSYVNLPDGNFGSVWEWSSIPQKIDLNGERITFKILW